ncbi:ATP-binding protein [Actinomarinicola tropica]|uniref:DUF853 family protein n=1 Tax=Actinomarinicola tropica TaxID=2789776 RepID=A0A5Q2RH74_9ACTN|nr:DUF87 domain-containing protein [Actinomarinicola tropica]QGG94202.1 DUF853 family protein [Actinomarinicola tropica]
MGADLFLGELIDPAAHERTGERLDHDADDLTTHGVIVGMTGSGKTGLGVVLIEEALRNGIPTLVLDPKGDMTNLALRFPGLTPDEFAPWVPEGSDPAETATSWADGLASWALDGSHVQGLADASRVTVYTPGSSAGVPLDLIGSLAAPTTDDAESIAAEIEGLISSLLSLVGITADPLSSREHILLTNLVAKAWSDGQSLDLGMLVHQVQDPPLRKLGVLELDTFYPAADRTSLALKLNGLLASPSFAAWTEGVPVDIGRMLSTDGGAVCSVVYLAHLSDEERQFVVTLLLTKLVTWMRGQSGSPGLRALVYMDEVFGFVPPTAMPPAKQPILTILKQARAYGVGMVLSTQNPVDLDYKAISNAGAWMIGRLQTERDVGRLEEGLAASSGEVDVAALSVSIAGLGKREFVLHTTKGSAPRTFTTRWALDYLAGPLTKAQVSQLPGQPTTPAASPSPVTAAPADAPPAVADAPTAASPSTASPTAALAEDEVAVVPRTAEGTPVRWVDPAAPWLPEVGGAPTSTTYVAGIAARVELLFDETKADLRHVEEYELVTVGLTDPFEADEAVAVDFDDRDLRDAAPEGATYVLPTAPIDTKRYVDAATSAITARIHRDNTLALSVNKELKLYSRPGETHEEFLARCHAAADEAADAETAKLRARLESKMSTVRTAIERENIRVEELRQKAGDAKQHEWISGAGDLLGSLLGGRRSTRSMLGKVKGASSRRRSASTAEARVEAALAKVEQKEMELAELESELTDAMADIAAEWDATAEQVEEIEVGLEKADITVRQLSVVWVPIER